MVDFRALKLGCLARGKLYEDPIFKAVPQSLNLPDKPTENAITWKRPKEICKDPKFIVNGASRFDLDQGELGNCWFVAAASLLATNPALFQKVVATDQSFGPRYAGIFRFNFWRYGHWQEVVIDDKLPVKHGKTLVFCKNHEEPNEFWSALLEKAYAKVHGSYEALEGGKIQDALVDFTGGASEVIGLRGDTPNNLYSTLTQMSRKNSLMGCSIPASGSRIGVESEEGLYQGHAYSITGLAKVTVPGKVRKQRLLRLRNPFGKNEWSGAWSDGSEEWKNISPKEKQKLGLTIENDGEFWMSYEDWKEKFVELQLCHLTPQSAVIHQNVAKWSNEAYTGNWVKGLSAGGCGNPPYEDQYWQNPRYQIRLDEADDENEDGDPMCTVIVSLMQKDRRLMRSYLRSSATNKAIGADIYKFIGGSNISRPTSVNHGTLELERRTDRYVFFREMCFRHLLAPGTYCVIPSTFYPNETAEFYLRIITEKRAHVWETDEPPKPKVISLGMSKVLAAYREETVNGDNACLQLEVNGPSCERQKSSAEEYAAPSVLARVFAERTGDDETADASDIQHILTQVYRIEKQCDVMLGIDTCRILLTLMDTSKHGVLTVDEMTQLCQEINSWMEVYVHLSGQVENVLRVSDLKEAFNQLGFNISNKALSNLVRKYCGKSDVITFDDFVACVTKYTLSYESYDRLKETGPQSDLIPLDQWMEETLRM